MDVLPGWGEHLGTALSSIAESVQNIQDPNWKFKRALMQHLATNPDDMEKMGAALAQDPNYLKKIGFGDVGDQLRGYLINAGSRAHVMAAQQAAANPNSPEMQRAVTREITGGDTPEAVAGGELKTKVANAGVAAMADPKTAAIAGQVAATSQTPVEQATGEQNLQARALALAEQQRLANQRVIGEKLIKDKYGNRGIQQLAVQSIDENLPIEDFNAINAATDGEFVRIRQQEVMMRRQAHLDSLAEERANTARIRAERQGTDQLALIDARTAAAKYKESNAGDPKAWQDILTNPAAQARQDELLANPALATTAQDQKYLAIAQWQIRQRVANDVPELARLTESINSTIRTINGKRNKPEQIPEHLATLNGALAERNKLNPGYHGLQAIYAPVAGESRFAGFGQSTTKKLQFVDTDGKVVDEDIATAPRSRSTNITDSNGNRVTVMDSTKIPPNVDPDQLAQVIAKWNSQASKTAADRKAFLDFARKNDAKLAAAAAIQIQ